MSRFSMSLHYDDSYWESCMFCQLWPAHAVSIPYLLISVHPLPIFYMLNFQLTVSQFFVVVDLEQVEENLNQRFWAVILRYRHLAVQMHTDRISEMYQRWRLWYKYVVHYCCLQHNFVSKKGYPQKSKILEWFEAPDGNWPWTLWRILTSFNGIPLEEVLKDMQTTLFSE